MCIIIRRSIKEKTHKIPKLAERKIQGPVSSCRKLYGPASHRSREWATSCSNDFPYVARRVSLCPRLEVNSLVLAISSAPNAP